MQFVDLDPGDARLHRDVLPVLVELRPHLDGQQLDAIYDEGHAQGLRYRAAYDGERCVAEAKAAGCTVVDLDSGVQRGDAHRFYMREGFTIASFRFALRVS